MTELNMVSSMIGATSMAIHGMTIQISSPDSGFISIRNGMCGKRYLLRLIWIPRQARTASIPPITISNCA